METNISQILTEARSHLLESRVKAEKTLEQMAVTDFFEFLKLLASELSNEQKIKENRQLAATIIKNMITCLEAQRNIWLNFPDEKSTYLKNSILSSLASNIKEVRRAAGHTIAGNIHKIYKLFKFLKF